MTEIIQTMKDVKMIDLERSMDGIDQEGIIQKMIFELDNVEMGLLLLMKNERMIVQQIV